MFSLARLIGQIRCQRARTARRAPRLAPAFPRERPRPTGSRVPGSAEENDPCAGGEAALSDVDEKSQIQALDRTQPGLPMKKGRCGTLTHDYKRHGTTTLFAALNMLTGQVIGECHGRHRHQEFLKFLRQLHRAFPRRLDLHLILDNYGTHKHPTVRAWLAAHPRFNLHFTPTGASWLNLVESWFSQLTQKRLRRGVFRSVGELVAAIEDYLQHYNDNPKPFVWTATVDAILKKVGKCKVILGTHH